MFAMKLNNKYNNCLYIDQNKKNYSENKIKIVYMWVEAIGGILLIFCFNGVRVYFSENFDYLFFVLSFNLSV